MSKNKENKVHPSTATKAEGIIKSLVTLVGVTAGIIIMAIGVIMFLESVFKIYVFDLKQDRYNSYEYRCQQYDVDSIKANRLLGNRGLMPIELELGMAQSGNGKTDKDKDLTKEDIKFLKEKYSECKKEVKEEAEKNFQRGEKMDIAEGTAFMIVGFALLFFYQRRRKNK